MTKRLFSFLKHPRTIKIVSLFAILVFCFVSFSYASTDTTNETLKDINSFLQDVISLLSRGRVILATLAGKLMTNDFVYGSFIHMDVYLRKIWNMIKNFANFALIALVIGSIIKNLLGKEGIDVKKIITNTLIAGVLIQMSRFLMGALIDISTIATIGVSGFPNSFIQNDTNLKTNLNTSAAYIKSKKLIIDLDSTSLKDGITTEPINTVTEDADAREKFLPTHHSISGPFIYLGMGIFNFQDIMAMGTHEKITTMTLSFAVRFMFIFFFTVALFLLFIANIMRIGLLWIFIIGAPFLILALLFKLKLGDKGIGKLFSISNLLAIVFKPVIFVAGMSIMLIVVLSMSRILTSSATMNNLPNVEFELSDGFSKMHIEGISTIQMNESNLFAQGETIKKDVQNTFAQLIIMCMTIFLMRWMVKLSLTLGGGPIEDTMKKMTGRAEGLAGSLPILPIKGGISAFAAKTAFERQQYQMSEKAGMDPQGRFYKAARAFQNMIDTNLLGIRPAWGADDIREIEQVMVGRQDPKMFFDISRERGKQRLGGLTLQRGDRKGVFVQGLKEGKFDGLFNKPRDADESLPIFDQYFKGDTPTHKENRQMLHNHMGGNTADMYNEERDGTANHIPYYELVNNRYFSEDKKENSTKTE